MLLQILLMSINTSNLFKINLNLPVSSIVCATLFFRTYWLSAAYEFFSIQYWSKMFFNGWFQNNYLLKNILFKYFIFFLELRDIVVSENLTLSKVNRSDMGIYLCLARSPVPPIMSKRFTVRVNCKYLFLFFYFMIYSIIYLLVIQNFMSYINPV